MSAIQIVSMIVAICGAAMSIYFAIQTFRTSGSEREEDRGEK